MSKQKRKRYIVYYTRSYGFWFSERTIWSSCTPKTRSELINYVLSKEEDFFDHLIKEISNDIRTYVDIPIESDRPGVKRWQRKYVHWYCIKVLHNGEEIPIDYTALYNEVMRTKKNRTSKKYYSGYYYRPCVNWKKQYKCKHQYEIHMNPHKDTIKHTDMAELADALDNKD